MKNKLIKIKLFLIKIKQSLIKFGWIIIRNITKPQLPKNPDGKVYVNLGCGRNTGKEYINIDTVTIPHMHYINDITDLYMFPSESVDLLYASHVIEHIPRSKLRKTLKEWYRVLKSGGIFRFAVPDFDRIIEVYVGNGRDVNMIINQVMGSEGEYDDHHTLWNIKYASDVLKEIGFQDIKIWDYKNVDHHDFNDKSNRTMSAGDKEILISLNIEAKK